MANINITTHEAAPRRGSLAVRAEVAVLMPKTQSARQWHQILRRFLLDRTPLLADRLLDLSRWASEKAITLHQ